MIHEVMVLDHGGPDLAFIQYAGGAEAVGPRIARRRHSACRSAPGHVALDLAVGLAGMFVLAVATGCVESTMARLRLVRVPQLLVAATVLSVLALILVLR